MKRRTKILLGALAGLLVLTALGTVWWVRRFKDYTPAEAVQDLRAAAAARNAPRPVERFLELRYGPLSEAENRERAFLDFFNSGHIEGLYIITGRMSGAQKQTNITAMAQWVADYRSSMSPEEKQRLDAYFRSTAGQAKLRRATAQYLSHDGALSGRHRSGDPGVDDHGNRSSPTLNL